MIFCVRGGRVARERTRFVSICKQRAFAVGIGSAVMILLGTFNGERFLRELLALLVKQTFRNWRLIASDDESSNRAKSILHEFQESFEPGKVEVIPGPRRGAPGNFLFLACTENLDSDFYAFCDQDDIWEPDRL